MTPSSLVELGWNAELATLFAPHAPLSPARVVAEHRSRYDVESEHGELSAELAGRLRHERPRHEWPAVGDWVALEPRLSERRATIRAVLPRRTCFVRKTAGESPEQQVIVANVDVAFCVLALDRDFSPRRLERYLTLAWESGAAPVVVLTKSDVAEMRDERVAEVRAIALGAPVLVASGLTGEGVQDVRALLSNGKTGALLGSSGVGKSTLVNALLGEEVQRVDHVRAHDGTGQHVTTRRELFRIPGGGLLIDAPGMREIQLWSTGESESGLEDAFAEIAELSATCRFRDCAHDAEPGCAVRAAIDEGRLDETRLRAFGKLQRELARLEAKRARATRSRAAPRRTRG